MVPEAAIAARVSGLFFSIFPSPQLPLGYRARSFVSFFRRRSSRTGIGLVPSFFRWACCQRASERRFFTAAGASLWSPREPGSGFRHPDQLKTGLPVTTFSVATFGIQGCQFQYLNLLVSACNGCALHRTAHLVFHSERNKIARIFDIEKCKLATLISAVTQEPGYFSVFLRYFGRFDRNLPASFVLPFALYIVVVVYLFAIHTKQTNITSIVVIHYDFSSCS